MDTSLQSIYQIVGWVGFALAALFAIIAVVYFVRNDIKGVLDELSGKTRREALEGRATEKRGRSRKREAAEEPASARRNMVTQDDSWKGQIQQGDLDDTTGSDALTDEGSGSSSSSPSSSSSGWSYSDAVRKSAQHNAAVAASPSDSSAPSPDDAATEVDPRLSGKQSDETHRVPAPTFGDSEQAKDAPFVSDLEDDEDEAQTTVFKPSQGVHDFVLLRNFVEAHSPNIIDEQGLEVPYASAPDATTQAGGR